MNIKNKQHNFYLDFKYCKILKSLGLPQTLSGAEGHFWFNNDRRVYPADKIIKFPGWEKSYTRAWTGAELNMYIPDGTVITKSGKLWQIKSPPFKGVPEGRGMYLGNTEAQAKAMLIKYLVSKSLINI